MRQVTEVFTVYKYNTAPDDVKEKIRETFANDSFLYDHCLQERLNSLEKFSELLIGTLDYSISCVPCRGEYITIKPKYAEGLSFDNLYEMIIIKKDCSLTGVCYDHDLLDAFKRPEDFNEETLKEVLQCYIDSIHSEYQSMLEDDYISDLCEANEYEFTENGKFYHG